MKVAVIGARAGILGNRPNIGYYHVREFRNAGANIVAIVNQQSAEESARIIANDFKIAPRPFSCLEEMLDQIRPDVVSVASSNSTHYEFARKALDYGAHVFCEKPLVWQDSPKKSVELAEELFRTANERGRILSVNTQNAYLMDKYLENFNAQRHLGFWIHHATKGKYQGIEIPLDLLPHSLGMLSKLDPTVEIIGISGNISDTNADLMLEFHPEKGRNFPVALTYEEGVSENKIRFGFGGDRAVGKDYVSRREHRVENVTRYYLIHSNGTMVWIEDPLKVSISRFYDAVSSNDKAKLLVPENEATANMRLMSQIIDYLKKS